MKKRIINKTFFKLCCSSNLFYHAAELEKWSETKSQLEIKRIWPLSLKNSAMGLRGRMVDLKLRYKCLWAGSSKRALRGIAGGIENSVIKKNMFRWKTWNYFHEFPGRNFSIAHSRRHIIFVQIPIKVTVWTSPESFILVSLEKTLNNYFNTSISSREQTLMNKLWENLRNSWERKLHKKWWWTFVFFFI